jgi:hypothetical protein
LLPSQLCRLLSIDEKEPAPILLLPAELVDGKSFSELFLVDPEGKLVKGPSFYHGFKACTEVEPPPSIVVAMVAVVLIDGNFFGV